MDPEVVYFIKLQMVVETLRKLGMGSAPYSVPWDYYAQVPVMCGQVLPPPGLPTSLWVWESAAWAHHRYGSQSQG